MNRKNIKIFYVLAFLQGLVFYSSIATLYRTANGITLLEMGIIESFFSIFMILLELPWGMLCDRIGYKKTMIISNGFYFLSKVIFWKANGFEMFLLERLLLALSSSGLSGCSSSLLYLSTTPDKAAGTYGKESMFAVMGMTVASMGLTFVFKTDMRGAAFATTIPYFFAFLLTMCLDDIKETQKKQVSFKEIFKTLPTEPAQAHPSRHTLCSFRSKSGQQKTKHILLVLLASVLLSDTTHTLVIFYSQLQYERVGIPVEYYGIIFMLLQFVSMSCGMLGSITKHMTKEKLVCFLFPLAGISIVGLLFSEGILSTIICLMVLMCVESIYLPILSTIENESVEISARATMLSAYSLIKNLFTAFTSFGFGKAANISLQHAYLLALVFCAGGYLLFLLWQKKELNS